MFRVFDIVAAACGAAHEERTGHWTWPHVTKSGKTWYYAAGQGLITVYFTPVVRDCNKVDMLA